MHGVTDADVAHALDHALDAAEQDDGKVLYLGADRAGNMLDVVSVTRGDDTEIVIHAMRMRRIYELLVRQIIRRVIGWLRPVLRDGRRLALRAEWPLVFAGTGVLRAVVRSSSDDDVVTRGQGGRRC